MHRRPGSPEWTAATRHPLRSALTRWRAGQACSGGSAGPELPDAGGAGAILFSQQTGHSTCACPCRPCSCSHVKYAAPATSNKPGPPPKGSPRILGIRRSMEGHLPIGKAVRSGGALAAGPFQCGTAVRICGGFIDAETSCGCPRNAGPDQTAAGSRQPAALNHRSRTVSGSQSAVARIADYFVVSSRFIAGSGGRRTANYERTGRSGSPASGRQLF